MSLKTLQSTILMISTITVSLAIILLASFLVQRTILHADQPTQHCQCCQSFEVEAAMAEYLSEEKPDSDEEEPEPAEPRLLSVGDMTVTIYHAVPAQTDDTPMITASGLDLEGHDLTELRVCALSRDLLARWGGPFDYGDQIFIDLPEPELSGWWTIEDTMASRWTNRIDLLVPTSRKGGKWTNIEALCLQ